MIWGRCVVHRTTPGAQGVCDLAFRDGLPERGVLGRGRERVRVEEVRLRLARLVPAARVEHTARRVVGLYDKNEKY